MNNFIILSFGIVLAILGGAFWLYADSDKKQSTMSQNNPISIQVVTSIAIVLAGAICMVASINQILHANFQYPNVYEHNVNNVKNASISSWCMALFLIFIGSISYTIAAYYHLSISDNKWSFLTAFLIAIPFILIEYQFSLRGNFMAKYKLGLSALQITLVTMVFYFVNSWILTVYWLKQPITWWREIVAFSMILGAFALTTTAR